jgi:hypothetical protein
LGPAMSTTSALRAATQLLRRAMMRVMKKLRFDRLSRLSHTVRELVPYAAAILLPGGIPILLLLWALRHRPWLSTWDSILRGSDLRG